VSEAVKYRFRIPWRLPAVDEPAGNAFAILGAWQRLAKECGWSRAEIDATLKEATGGDYEHLRSVLGATLTDPDDEGEGA